MWLPQTAEYALRAMAALVEVEGKEALKAADISARTDVPVAYLSKVLRRLVVAGIVEARRGHGGGFTLARPAGEITVAEVLEAVDVDVTSKRCAFGWSKCSDDTPCPLHPIWRDLRERLSTWSRGTSLDQVGGPEGGRGSCGGRDGGPLGPARG